MSDRNTVTLDLATYEEYKKQEKTIIDQACKINMLENNNFIKIKLNFSSSRISEPYNYSFVVDLDEKYEDITADIMKNFNNIFGQKQKLTSSYLQFEQVKTKWWYKLFNKKFQKGEINEIKSKNMAN